MKVLLSLVLAFAVVFLLNNLDSNVYAQELQCPLIHPFLPLVDETLEESSRVDCSYEFEEDLDGDGVLEKTGYSSIHTYYVGSDLIFDTTNITCWDMAYL